MSKHRKNIAKPRSQQAPSAPAESRVKIENQRLLDLVRYCRSELHATGLITDEEYTALLQESGAVARLGSYDSFQVQIKTLTAELADLKTQFTELTVVHGQTARELDATKDVLKEAEDKLNSVLARAAIFDDKPHLLFSYIRHLAASHPQFTEIARLMDRAYSKIHAWRKSEETEQALRRLLWLHHGHDGLYGDDGEMQCGRCMLDFKRDPVERIERELARPAFKIVQVHDSPKENSGE